MNSNRSSGEQLEEIALSMASIPESSVDELETEQYLRMISLLNHYRHDWMNEIQLLFGYIKLKKYDKLDGLMEKIKVKVQRESLLSKLGAPRLIVYLFSFQSEVKDLPLEIHIEQEIHLNELFSDIESVSSLLIEVMELLKSNARKHPESGHQLTLRLRSDTKCLYAAFEYQGAYDRSLIEDQLGPLLQQSKPEFDRFIKLEDHQAVIVISVPLNI